MKANPAIALAVPPKPKPESKPPKWYGRLLEREREAAGMSRREFAEKTKIDDVTILRNETGADLRSVKGSSRIKAALEAMGRHLPPVPVGDVPEPDLVVSSKLDPADEVVRRNMVRFRAAVNMDVFAAAHASGLSVDELKDYELGEKIPTNAVLSRLADTYGCNRGAFLDDTDQLPKFEIEKQPALYFGGRAAHLLTPEEEAALEKITASVNARDRAEKQAVATHMKKVKKPR